MWLINSSYSNHMPGKRDLFVDLDESHKLKVKLGDNKEVQVQGRGTVAIKTNQGKVKLIHDVQYVPDIAHNLMSVGQLLTCGYSVRFEQDTCYIIDEASSRLLACVQTTRYRMLALEISDAGCLNVMAGQ